MVKAPKILIAVDTSAWLSLSEHPVDFVRDVEKMAIGVEWGVPKSVLTELKTLEKKGKTMAKKVKVAQMAIHNMQAKTLESEEKTADKALIKIAMQGTIIATNDTRLRSAIRAKGGHCLFLRKKQHWIIE